MYKNIPATRTALEHTGQNCTRTYQTETELHKNIPDRTASEHTR